MSLEHLSDEQIQQYIENSMKPDDAVEKHLSDCQVCRAALENYKILFKALPNTDEELLSVDFNSVVMSKIEKLEKADEKSYLETVIYVLSGVAACLGALIYIMGSEAILYKIKTFSLASFLSEFSAFGIVKGLMSQHGSIVTILLFAALTIIFYGLLDRISRKFKVGKTSLLSI